MSKIDIQHAVFLFMDFQVDVCGEGGRMVSQDATVQANFIMARKNAAALLTTLRGSSAAERIGHVRHLFKPGFPETRGAYHSKMDGYVQGSDAFVEGSAGADWVPELQPQQGEYVFTKKTLSPFASTELGWWMNRRKINTVVLSGVVTHYVIMATAIAAYDLGYEVVVVRDCCMSGTDESHAIALEILNPLSHVMDSADLLAQLDK